MRPTGFVKPLVGGPSKLVRVAMTIAALTSGLLLGAAAVAPGAAFALCGISTNVDGHIHNETDVTLNLQSASHGITNNWCVSPPSTVPANSNPDKYYYEAGDNIFDTVTNAVYKAPNGDTISLSADAKLFSYGASCSVSPGNGKTAAYACQSTASHNGDSGGNNTVADFYITRTPGASEQFLTVSPRKTNPGKTISVSGEVGNACQTGHTGDAAIIYSKAFKGAAKHSFHRVPSVSVSLRRSHTGAFSFKLRLSRQLKAGTYTVDGRCGGGKFGSTTLKVTKRR
jgi:hypothetical protein